ncbi:MAG: hypothetical protein E7047_09955 [Lentisphaerae bacterium]|nr:hypothetical protein [Lentisphaerota bacterium]
MNVGLKAVLLLIVVSWCCIICTAGGAEVGKGYRKAAKEYRFDILVNEPLPPHLRGKKLPVRDIEAELNLFFEALDDLGEKFVRKSGLKYVMICRDLSRQGKALSGHTYKEYIYLDVKFKKRTVYHEMFHVFDDKFDNKQWRRLNHPDFRYHGVIYPQGRKNTAEVQRAEKFKKGFASAYAMSSEREDRAETFAAMVEEGPAFVARAEKSKILYNKMLYIIELTGRNSLLGKDFWPRKLGNAKFGKPAKLKKQLE